MEPLYHYTSAEGLHGIIATHSIWAGSINFMNDIREVGYSWDLTMQEIDRLRGESGADDAFGLAVEEYSKLTRDPHIAVFSLSEAPDQLSQWRGYAADGFAVGFDPMALERVAANSDFKLVKCIYDKGEQVEMVGRRVTQRLAAFREAVAEGMNPEQAAEPAAHDLAVDVIRISPRIKDPTFEEEREWRLVSGIIRADSGPWKLRLRGKTISPYVVLDLGDRNDSPIRTVMRGPTQNGELAERSLHQLTHTYGVSFQREASAIPYRTS